jgi:predicted anti-sigma-YlaC factor YlaD
MSLFYALYYPCDKVRDFAYDYLEGKLGLLTGFRFKRHLRGCEECQEYIKLYRMAADPSKFTFENPLPSEFLDHTLQFLKERGVVGDG